jgi:hypothetical protein
MSMTFLCVIDTVCSLCLMLRDHSICVTNLLLQSKHVQLNIPDILRFILYCHSFNNLFVMICVERDFYIIASKELVLDLV